MKKDDIWFLKNMHGVFPMAQNFWRYAEEEDARKTIDLITKRFNVKIQIKQNNQGANIIGKDENVEKFLKHIQWHEFLKETKE